MDGAYPDLQQIPIGFMASCLLWGMILIQTRRKTLLCIRMVKTCWFG